MKYNITVVLPVSREQYLDRVLESLMNQNYKAKSLLVIFDGAEDRYTEVRNKIVQLDFEHVLCVRSHNKRSAFNIPERRIHIAGIHNQFKELLGECDYVFSIEDDGILPRDALFRLVKVTKNKEDAGLITGVELGRWGVPYVGAWRVDNIEKVNIISSLENKTLQEPTIVEDIDACGLYCALIRSDLYKEHTFFTENGLGPDVNLGLFIRKKGLKNYIDWGVPVTHLTNKDGEEIEIPATSDSKNVKLVLLSGNTWQATR